MPGSDTAFNRIKSLLGKMDRSIDDARHQRLHADEDEGVNGGVDEIHPDSVVILPDTEQQALEVQDKPVPATPRPPSKYGRARPIREIPKGSSENSDGSAGGFSRPSNSDTDAGWKTA